MRLIPTLGARARRHRGFLVILIGHALVWAAVVGRGSRWATLAVDCVAGGVGESMLSEPVWSAWSVVDGLVGGQVIYALVALPFYALLGTAGGVAGKLAAWLISAGLLCLIYALGCRAAGRPAGVLASASVAFAPPLVFAGSMATGNWHWSEMVFEYGAALTALAVAWPRGGSADRPTPHLGLGLLALLSGVGVFNSPQSIPFLALAWLVAAVGCGPRRLLKGLPAATAGAALGLAAPLWRLMGLWAASDGPPKGTSWQRLLRFSPEWNKLTDLVWPELPVTLHVREAVPWLPSGVNGGLETAWVLVCWVGCLLTLIGVVQRRRERQAELRALVASLLPVGFALAFAAAYVALDVRIRVADPLFSEYREASHRLLPPLLVAMTVGAAPGWVWLWRYLGRLTAGPLRGSLRAGVVGLALLPAAIGLLCQVSMAVEAPGRGPAGLALYRGSCFDAPGFFLVGKLRDRAAAEARCASLSTRHRQQDCLVGVALGLGFYAARLEGPDEPGDGPCDPLRGDFGGRCPSWNPAESPDLGPGLEPACSALPEHRRAVCFMGAGWRASQLVWGSEQWPLLACDSLSEARDRQACWWGPGFQLGDHIGHTPHRIGPLLERVPASRRSAVAAGVGFAQGSQWAAEHIAVALCQTLEPELAEACELGVGRGRRHAHPGSGE